MKKITNIELKEQPDFAFIYNHQMCNVTVVSHNLTFELDVVWNSDIDNYYPEYYTNFINVIDLIPGVVFNSIDYLIDNGIPRFNNETEKVDIKDFKEDFIYVEFLRFDNHEQIKERSNKKSNNILFNIKDYLIYRDYKKLNNKLKIKDKGKVEIKKI